MIKGTNTLASDWDPSIDTNHLLQQRKPALCFLMMIHRRLKTLPLTGRLKSVLLFMAGLMSWGALSAQSMNYLPQAEIGIGLGTAHYFGDLNPEGSLSPVHYSAQAFYQRYLGSYIGVRLSGSYVHLAASDKDNKDAAYHNRGLDFANNIIELSLSGSFNFFKYAPGVQGHSFTPYVGLGIGGIYSDPYTHTDQGEKVSLRKLGTEGQLSSTPHDGQKYGALAMIFPLSVGVRQAISPKLNIFAEATYRFTTSDYLDDVSTTYAGTTAFDGANYKGSAAQAARALALQDRSLDGKARAAGWQRGNSLAKDRYMTLQIGLSFNFGTCNCPEVY
ncbi:hypothetical protein SAMN05192529_12935 [Arachidicoccus rhizosphaerae]|uniref:DUF6089 domain-containing protein n=1 Tax=Arachidicoccus rhizosphaerae TaxID=551991 RepID=A0A1H4CAE2_9BACT|nr:DUF6089 family protein [Arachidicoccus rhizosphaerae]SEA57259.1 hypothetical protein SAMN05192529_12935 [Arachidicoccus rhizosphaerae]